MRNLHASGLSEAVSTSIAPQHGVEEGTDVQMEQDGADR